MHKIGFQVESDTSVLDPGSGLTGTREGRNPKAARGSHDPGDHPAAAAELWRKHAQWISHLARRYQHQSGMDMSDLVSTGYLALHEGLSKRMPGENLPNHIEKMMRRHVRGQEGVATEREGAMPAAHRQIALLGQWLLAGARRDCAREGMEPTEMTLFARIGHRLDLPAAAVARALHRTGRGQVTIASSVARLDEARARRRLIRLTESVLGARERAVFLARYDAAGTPIENLALAMGLSPDRVTVLEHSARRKLAIAAYGEGLNAAI